MHNFSKFFPISLAHLHTIIYSLKTLLAYSTRVLQIFIGWSA